MPIVYYDGNCVYCYNYCIWLIQHGLPKNYEFATLKGEAGQHLFEQHPEAKNKKCDTTRRRSFILRVYCSSKINHNIK